MHSIVAMLPALYGQFYYLLCIEIFSGGFSTIFQQYHINTTWSKPCGRYTSEHEREDRRYLVLKTFPLLTDSRSMCHPTSQ